MHTSLNTVLPAWQQFEKDAIGAFYQGSLWCRAWLETVGRKLDVTPRVVTVCDEFGDLAMLLPLQLRRRHGVMVLEWLGTPHIGYGFGLYHRQGLALWGHWLAENFQAVLEAAGPFDAAALVEMPERLAGYSHPMHDRFTLAGPNRSFTSALPADFETLHRRKRDSENRRSMRKKEEQLAMLGPIDFGLPEGRGEIHSTLETMFAQQRDRLAERGIHGVFGVHEQAFIHRLADLQDDADPILAPYRLSCGGEVLAVMLGATWGGGYWALISSLVAGHWRRYSPGDMALRKTVAACCARGLRFFDFSAGDQPYKRAWADEAIELHAHVSARTLKGLAWALAFACALLLKGAVKRSDMLLGWASGLRRTCFGSGSGSGPVTR